MLLKPSLSGPWDWGTAGEACSIGHAAEGRNLHEAGWREGTGVCWVMWGEVKAGKAEQWGMGTWGRVKACGARGRGWDRR